MNTKKVCKDCGNYLSLDDFHIKNSMKDNRRNTCKVCITEVSKRSYEKNKHKRRVKEIKDRSTVEGHFKHIISNIKKRSKDKGLDCDIEYKTLMGLWEEQDGRCKLTGRPLTVQKGVGILQTTCSVDRIDSSKGYVIGNIRLVCDVVNIMKGTMTDIELKEWCVCVVQGL